MDRDLQALLLRDNPWLVDDGALAGWLPARLPATFIPRHLADADQRWPVPTIWLGCKITGRGF